MSEIQFESMDEPSKLYGPAVNAGAGANGVPVVNVTVPIRVGDPDRASAMVEVIEHGDGEIEYIFTCLCDTCQELDGTGIPDYLFECNVYGKPIPGVYYIRAWHSVSPAGPWGPSEHDGGLEIAE